jgi:hypothetical protein
VAPVLATGAHEALVPSVVRNSPACPVWSGSAALDALARAMGAKLIVHGHHHVNYLATAEDGLQALGVAAAWGATASGEILWEGEAPRHLTASPEGWVRSSL